MEVRRVCDGYDVQTDVGILHFTQKPTETEILDTITNLTVVPELTEVVAEDGVAV